jgi:hypothetical protein
MIGVASGLLSIAFTVGEARAGILQITLTEGPVSYVILDEGPLDTLLFPPADNINKIQALAAALVFTDYKLVGLNASTNNPGSTNPAIGATLTMGGEVQRITSGTAPPLVITVTDTDYSLPPGLRSLHSTFSTTFTGAPAGDTRTFTSWYNPSNAPNATDVVQGPPVPLSHSSTGLFLNSHGDTAAITGVPSASLYGLTNTTVITLSAGADVVFAGSTAVTPIPEPTSILLLALGLPSTIWSLRRRRRASRARA